MGIIERVNRTLKTILFKYATATGHNNWFNVISEIASGLNTSIHGTTQRRPVDIVNGTQQPIAQKEPKFIGIEVGTKVRLILNRNKFSKGYEARFTKGIYSVTGKKGNRYLVTGRDGLENRRSYKESELQVVLDSQKIPAGARENERLRDISLQLPTGKRVPKKKLPYGAT
ncbi:hypothetical protein DFS34DRAFT_581619 [Phlyctochytrium arcticum]|nr:hypothetical protein DFS34DRAFT_581619 [Phlyctochytrium arcticum]